MSAGNRSLEQDIEDIDDLPRAPRDPALAFVTIHKVCTTAVRWARDTPAEEDKLGTLTRHVRGMEPRDPTTRTLDGWTRMGAVEGAIRGWRGEKLIPPKDAPTDQHVAHYMGAGLWAFGIVSGLKHSLSKGVR